MDKASDVLKSIEKIAEKRFIPSIGPVKGKILAEIIKKHKLNHIFEIGSLYGYSAILMAKEDKNAHITTIEIDKQNATITQENIEKAGLSNRIKVVQGDAVKIIPEISDSFDLLFLDAAKDQYLKYLQSAEKNLKKGSVIVADNVGIFEKELKTYLMYVRESGKYQSETIKVLLEYHDDVYDAMEVSVKLHKD
ncbi:class I SAM-dependent methyltransferase [Candidatus Pacearchaeota archaeon]|nr:class I SAM-dependent methyltransferase [Candidatus Pacearchaeota archaeon]